MKINKQNYESYLLDYVDNELPEAEQKQLLQYIASHPEVKEELEQLQKTKPVAAEQYVFPKKDRLYHTASSKKKILILSRQKIVAAVAVAACLLFIIGIYFNQDQDNSTKSIAKSEVETTTHAVSQKEETKSKVSSAKENVQGPKQNKHSNILLAKNTARTTGASTTEKTKTSAPAKSGNALSEITTENAADANSPTRLSVALTQITSQPVQPVEKQKTHITINQPVTMPPIAAATPPLNRKRISPPTPPDETIPATIEETVDKIKRNKQALNQAVSNKLLTLQEKVSHPVKLLNIKKIKIGHVSFVFN